MIGTPQAVGNVNCWFYVAANNACRSLAAGGQRRLRVAPLGVYGNAGLNILRGPHATIFDLSLMRDFDIIERARLQFRWEVFNPTNTPMFSLPNSNLSSGSVGTITSLAGDPRVMQVALRVSF